jgi:hypothetical protein
MLQLISRGFVQQGSVPGLFTPYPMIPSINRFPARLLLPCLLAASLAAQDRPWQKLSDPTVAEVAPNFPAPPSAYSSQVTWGWSGVVTRESIARDLDRIRAMNLYTAWVEPGRNPAARYLSPAYFENVRIAVEEAKKRGMHLWFDDDGGYPSGFAGGKFTTERPDLDMKALAPTEQTPVAARSDFLPRARRKDDLRGGRQSRHRRHQRDRHPVGPGELDRPGRRPLGRGAAALGVSFGRHQVGQQQVRREGQRTLVDGLSQPRGGSAIHQLDLRSLQAGGGRRVRQNVSGFRGDESAYGFNPWTPNFLAEFQARKGYDLRPYLPAISAIQIGRGGRAGRGFRAPADSTAFNLDAAHRAYADYCDVWSDLFGQNFFSAGARWCAANNLEMQTHIEHEEALPQLAIADGDFFKCMRDVAGPGHRCHLAPGLARRRRRLSETGLFGDPPRTATRRP